MKTQKIITLVVVISYLFKSTAKLIGGSLMAIPILIADGIHGLFDIAEHGFLVTGGYFARKQNRVKYPIDRQPLIDLMGLIIFTGLFIFGAAIFIESIKLFLVSMITFGWIPDSIPDWIIADDLLLSYTKSIYILFASLIMIGSYVISEVVYRFQYRLATKHNIREMKADAMELRSDGWLELGTGISLFVAWLFIQWFTGRSDDLSISGIISLFNSIILFFLGGYLMFIAWPEFWENFNNLMNRALDKDERLLLQKTLSRRLPIGCSIIEPLVCYHRGDQLFIKGHLSIDPGLMNSADLIIHNAEVTTKTFFSHSDLTIYTQFSPFFTISEKIIDIELGKVVWEAFTVPDSSPAGEAFRLLRKGNLEKSFDWATNNVHQDQRQELLAKYVIAEVCYRKFGANNDKTKKELEDILELLNADLGNEFRLFFTSWLLVYYSGIPLKDDALNAEVNSIRNTIENQYIDRITNNLNDYLLAEAYFAIGFSWERCSDYNLDLSRDYYRKSEYYYKRAGFRSEMDRLYNTWGHFETLTYSLGDAEIHLNYVREIRELKNDIHGLTFTYGCLGDLYSKTGNFMLAHEYYRKDIDLLNQLKIEHPLPGLHIKMADQLIKEGLFNNDLNHLRKAIDLCNGTSEKLNNPFFAYKGKTKGFLGLASLYKTEDEKNRMINDADEILHKAVAVSSYEKAFFHRLKGRLAGYKGNFIEAQEELIKSENLFENMRDPVHNKTFSVQSIVSGLESYKWSLNDEPKRLKSTFEECLSINALKDFISSEEEMLGALPNSLNALLTEYELAGGNMEKRTKALARLIWFLEG
jgi:divalent metal cation (Fe/Co/Zn/Cd) transporter/tetratricopeptide (TPR) repeat protein